MFEITNDMGKDVIYDESPHIIKTTGDYELIITTEPLIEKTEDYILDERAVGGALIPQE